MGRKSQFWDKHAKGYAKRAVGNEEAYQQKLKITQEYFNDTMDVLELGCGTGSTALVHSGFVKHIHGVDISPKMLEIAQSKIDNEGVENISFECSSMEAFIPDAGRYDMIMAHSLLHLLEDKEDLLRKINKGLKPEGLFISSTICMRDVMPLLRFILPIGRVFGLLPLVTFFTLTQLEKSLRDAGFTIERNWQPNKKQAAFIIARKAS